MVDALCQITLLDPALHLFELPRVDVVVLTNQMLLVHILHLLYVVVCFEDLVPVYQRLVKIWHAVLRIWVMSNDRLETAGVDTV